ncbi:hypothetical protein FACS1894216_01960 [Synergistales bacterium]|nr:hypothetical protein FACS1894216_01960 [Synergistales bacterium]
MNKMQKNKADTTTATAYAKSAQIATVKLKCVLVGEGDLNRYRQDVLRRNPQWDMFIDFVVPPEPMNPFAHLKERFGKLTKYDRVYIFADFPQRRYDMLKFVGDCKKEESKSICESSICVVINDDNHKYGATDIDAEEDPIDKAKKSFAELVGDDNVSTYNHQKNDITGLFYWKYHAYDEVLLELLRHSIKETKDRVNNYFSAEGGAYDDIDIIGCLEVIPVDDEKNYLLELERRKYTSSTYNYTESSTVRKITAELSELWFGNRHKIIAKEFMSFYNNDCMHSVMYWDADKDNEMLCSELKNLFTSFMEAPEYKASEEHPASMEYSDRLGQFFKNELKSFIHKYCLKRLSNLEGLV